MTYQKDIVRTIRKELRRFIAISVITFLGVTMFAGLKAGCEDLRYSADRFFDARNLFDLRVMSTLGFSDEDVERIGSVDGVLQAEGVFSEDAHVKTDQENVGVTIQSLGSGEINRPYLIEGKLPESSTEVAVTEKFLQDTGTKIGDTIEIEEETEDQEISLSSSGALKERTLTITGVVVDPADINNSVDGAVSYRNMSTSRTSLFVVAEAFETEYYTAVYLTLRGAKELKCFSEDYENLVSDSRNSLEDGLMKEHNDAAQDSAEDLENRVAALKTTTDEAEEAGDRAKDAGDEVSELSGQIQDLGEKSPNSADRIVASQLQKIEEKASDETQSGGESSADGTSSDMSALSGDGESEDSSGGIASLFSQSMSDEMRVLLEKYSDAAEKAQDLSDTAQAKADQAETEANEIKSKYGSDTREMIDRGVSVWYVQDRMALSGYTNIESDADSIESIGTAFPIVFLIVAVLISLTAVTRLVDEERGLIGTYKALGFDDGEILKKYVVYTGSAALSGCAAGVAGALLALPAVLFVVFRRMYLLPDYYFRNVPVTLSLGIFIFVASILLTTVLACTGQLRNTPASLMRPKAPKPGRRVLLEHIPFLWKRFSFLNKITARNLFRYKGRLLMTVLGIAGCTAIMLFGFGLRDTIHDLPAHQYDEICRYDMMAVVSSDDFDQLKSYLNESEVKEYQEIETTTISLTNPDKTRKNVDAQLIVVPEGGDISDYFGLKSPDGTDLILKDGDVFVSQNASSVLGFRSGGRVTAQIQYLDEVELDVTALMKNHLGNYVFMTQSTFEKYFTGYEANGVLVRLKGNSAEQKKFTSDFAEKDGIVSCVGTEDLKSQFSTSFQLINMVVGVILFMSAALAFVVLFTLSDTNISERSRELATIKVLGFHDREVHAYINKETWILTAIGILLGMPLGYSLAGTLTTILNLPSIELEVAVHSGSYLLAAILVLIFAFVVSCITNRKMDRIDPVEALKSVE